jgi:hypothetical protein
VDARQALIDACTLLHGQGEDTSMCPAWALPADEGDDETDENEEG